MQYQSRLQNNHLSLTYIRLLSTDTPSIKKSIVVKILHEQASQPFGSKTNTLSEQGRLPFIGFQFGHSNRICITVYSSPFLIMLCTYDLQNTMYCHIPIPLKLLRLTSIFCCFVSMLYTLMKSCSHSGIPGSFHSCKGSGIYGIPTFKEP